MRVIAAIGILLLALGAWFFFVQKAGAAVGIIDLYNGSVTIRTGEDEEVRASGDAVREDEIIIVPAGSRVGIVFDDGSVVRLDGPTTAIIHDLLAQREQLIKGRLELIEGRVWSKVKGRVLADYAVETPTIVATVRGTCFNVSYIAAVSTVYVSCGTVGVRLKQPGTGTGVLVEAGFMIQIRDEHAKEDLDNGPKPLPDGAKNEWIHFNEDEDGGGEEGAGSSSSSVSVVSSRSSAVRSSALSRSSVGQAAVSSTVASVVRTSSVASVAAPISQLRLSVDRTTIDVSEIAKLTATMVTGDEVVDWTQDVGWDVKPFVMGTVDRLGGFHPAETGTVSITAATEGHRSNTVTITVTSTQIGGGGTDGGTAPTQQQTPPPVVVTVSSMRVNCAKQSNQQITAGPGRVTAQCGATAIMSDGSTKDVTRNAAKWSVKGSGAGFIDQNGYYVSGADQGVDTVTADYEGKSGSATITVP